MDDAFAARSILRVKWRVRITTSSYWLAAGTAAVLLAMAAAGASGLLRGEPVRHCEDPRGGGDGDPALISLDTAKGTPCDDAVLVIRRAESRALGSRRVV